VASRKTSIKKARTRSAADRETARCCRNVYQFIRSRLGERISDREIARRWGMEWKSFAALKHGQRQVPRVHELEQLAEILGVDPVAVFQVARGLDLATLDRSLDGPLRARLERIASPMLTFDRTGTIYDVNAPLCALVGRSETALIGRSLLDLIVERSTVGAMSLLAGVAAGDAVLKGELVLAGANGAPVALEIEAVPIRDDEGRVLGGQALARDVSAERELARELNQQRQSLQTLFDRIPAACILYDEQRNVVATNPLVESVCGAGPPAASGAVTRAFLTGRIEQQVSWMTNRAGQRVYLHRTAGPIHEAGKVARVIEVLVDVTDEVRHGDLRVLSFWHAASDDAEAGSLDAERRTSPRAEVSFSAQLRHAGRVEMVHIENLGPGGLFIRTPARLKKGTEVELEWLLPNDRVPVRVKAVVAWIRPTIKGRPGGIGVRFLQIASPLARSAAAE
jgi:uncharacterized protein (TIGR02266 family)